MDQIGFRIIFFSVFNLIGSDRIKSDLEINLTNPISAPSLLTIKNWLINQLYLFKTRSWLWLECIDPCKCVFSVGTLLTFYDHQNMQLFDLVLNHKFITGKNIYFQKKFNGVKFCKFFVWQTYTKDLHTFSQFETNFTDFWSLEGGGLWYRT